MHESEGLSYTISQRTPRDDALLLHLQGIIKQGFTLHLLSSTVHK